MLAVVATTDVDRLQRSHAEPPVGPHRGEPVAAPVVLVERLADEATLEQESHHLPRLGDIS
jgi:hypothetical protein